MNADLYFSNVEFYAAQSGQRIRVLEGTVFTIRINEADGPFTIATTEDKVLAVAEGELSGVVASRAGTSEFQVQKDQQVVFYLTFEVFSGTEAASLGLTAGTAEPK